MSFISVPNFLKMPAVGLDISDDAVRFMEFKETKRGLEVSRYASRNFPIGVVKEGHVIEHKKLQEVLREFSKDYRLGFANVCLPEEQAYLANIRVPRAAAGDIAGAIELTLEEHVPIAVEEAEFGFVVVDDQEAKKEDYIEAVVSVLPKMIIEEYLEIFQGTGITPMAFEFESQAMARALIPKGDMGTFLVVDMGKLVTSIFVVGKGIVQFAAAIDIGGHHLTQAIEKKLGVSYNEAEVLKQKKGLVGNIANNELYLTIFPVINELRNKIVQHYSYWQGHSHEKAGGIVEKIYLSGGGANLRGFTEYLAIGLPVKVETANPWINVNNFGRYIPPILRTQSLGYAAAIGLALRAQNPSAI